MNRLGLALAYVLAVAAGLASAWLVLADVSAHGVRAGAWRASTLAGSTGADIYTRARVALGGLLALNREETMYYVAGTDSAGAPLRSRCRYRVHGRAPAARWWSITAYDDEMFLFPDDESRYSYAPHRDRGAASVRFALTSGPTPPAGDGFWLPTPGDRGLIFTLRLYNPDPALAAEPGRIEPPVIEPIGDCA